MFYFPFVRAEHIVGIAQFYAVKKNLGKGIDPVAPEIHPFGGEKTASVEFGYILITFMYQKRIFFIIHPRCV